MVGGLWKREKWKECIEHGGSTGWMEDEGKEDEGERREQAGRRQEDRRKEGMWVEWRKVEERRRAFPSGEGRGRKSTAREGLVARRASERAIERANACVRQDVARWRGLVRRVGPRAFPRFRESRISRQPSPRGFASLSAKRASPPLLRECERRVREQLSMVVQRYALKCMHAAP